jgi:hypothetical protein
MLLEAKPEGRAMPTRYPERARRGRINDAGCKWIRDLCGADLEGLKKKDKDAWKKVIALIEDSEQYGMPFDAEGDDYSAPVGERVRRSAFGGRPRPWLGELRVEERRRKRSALGNTAHYRLYFGEPEQPPNAILGLLVEEKRGRDLRAFEKQTAKMLKAMKMLIHWCEHQSPSCGWRTLEETR